MEWWPWIIVRLLAPLLIWKWQFVGALVAIVADNLDVVVWDVMGVEKLSQYYNPIDKALDMWIYLVAGMVVLTKWKNKRAKKAGVVLLVWRLLGFLIYELTGWRYLLFIFPNLFWTFFVVYTGWMAMTKKDPINSSRRLGLLLLVLAIPKLAQEYLFHVVEFDLYGLFNDVVGWVANLV